MLFPVRKRPAQRAMKAAKAGEEAEEQPGAEEEQVPREEEEAEAEAAQEEVAEGDLPVLKRPAAKRAKTVKAEPKTEEEAPEKGAPVLKRPAAKAAEAEEKEEAEEEEAPEKEAPVLKRPAAKAAEAEEKEEAEEEAAEEEEAPVLKRPAAKAAEPAAEASKQPKQLKKRIFPVLKRPAAAEDEAAEEAEEEEAAAPVLKKPAAKAAEPAAEEKAEAEEAAPAPKPVDEAKEQKRIEEEIVAARRKELKGIPVDQLKQLVEGLSLEFGKKEEMVERVVKHEAKARADARAHQAKIRQVVEDKKAELEALSAPELKDRCVEEGIKGQLAKPARIEALMKLWQDSDGVEKELVKIARRAREEEFGGMDAKALQSLCSKIGVDPFVKEVMVDRIVKREGAAGRFGRPALDRKEETVPASVAAGGDMVEALIASEAQRKRERELKKQEEGDVAQKKADLQGKSVDQLKKLLTSKGRAASGKKDELIEELIQLGAQEKAAAKREVELKALELLELKRLLQSKALEVSSKKDDMIKTLLAYEAQVCAAAIAYSGKIEEVIAEKRKAWETKTTAELKEICATKDLKGGASKDALIGHLVEDLKSTGEIDKVLAVKARNGRREELQAMDKDAVLKRCALLEIDPLVKEVMVERLLAYEAEFGRADGRAAKRARKSK